MISDNVRGAGLMMVAMAGFTVNDTFLKMLAGQVPLIQLIVVRGAMASVALAVLAWSMGAFRVNLSRHDWTLMGVRALAEAAAAYFFLTALFHMPLANATAILQAVPFTVTLAAALVLGQTFGWRRGVTILVGFIGVLLIVRPGQEGFNIYSVYAIVAVVCVTLRDLATRKLAKSVPSLMVTFTSAAGVGLCFALLQIPQDWAPMTLYQFGLLTASTLAIVCGYAFSVMVMRVGDISFIAPFRYTGLVWALVLGYLIFGDFPRPLTLLGCAIIVASGIYMLYRESRPTGHMARQTLAKGGR